MQLETIRMVSLAQDGRMVAAEELKEGDVSKSSSHSFALWTRHRAAFMESSPVQNMFRQSRHEPTCFFFFCAFFAVGDVRQDRLSLSSFVADVCSRASEQYLSGDVISLRPGEECPADGVVTRGSASCSEAVPWPDRTDQTRSCGRTEPNHEGDHW